MSRVVKPLIILILLTALFLVLGFLYFKNSKIETVTSDDQALSDSESPVNDVTYDKEGKNIIVLSPEIGATVSYPIKLIGRARVFENQFNYSLTDSEGSVLAEGFGMTDALDVGLYGPFLREIFYKLPTTKAATLEVFQYSMQDGSEQDKVSVPVNFPVVTPQKVKVFMNPVDEPSNYCDKVSAVERLVPRTQRVARAALEELLRGPLPSETGFVSLIPKGTQVKSLTIENGIAKVDFNYALNQTGGSCAVGLIRAQIEETLKQFSSVTSVIISVDGDTEMVLQP